MEIAQIFQLLAEFVEIRPPAASTVLSPLRWAQGGSAVAVTLQIATFVHGWANMSLEYKLMQRRVRADKNDSRSSGGVIGRRKLAVFWRGACCHLE
jgi:hypothetical protein